MLPLDEFQPEILSEENARAVLSDGEYAAYRGLSPTARQEQLHDLITKPIARFTPVNEVYFRTKWSRLVRSLCGEKKISLLEVASGDADMIPQALARSHPGSTYLTANMNRALNESLLKKTDGLPLDFHLIADDASRLAEYVEPGTVDLIAFQHGVNDVLQAILCGLYGVDTVFSDWMESLPQMIRILQRETAAGTLEGHVREPFLALMKTLLGCLRPGGVIAIHHYMFQLDLDWGYPPDLFENLIPMVRPWFAEASGLKEISQSGCPAQWWLFFKKRAGTPSA